MISKLTDEQLSRWIAEKIGWHYGENPEWPDRYVEPCWWSSPDGEPYEKYPDFINDLAMTVMLLEKLLNLDTELKLWQAQYKIGLRYEIEVNRLKPPLLRAQSEKLGHAVAKAFMLANGWTA